MKTKLLAIALVLTSALYPLATLGATKQFQKDTGGTLTTGLQAYYKLEDTNDFWSTNNLTNNNSATFTTGKVNNAVDFGSANTNKSLTIASNLGIDGGSASVSAWVNITTAPASGSLYTIASTFSSVSKVAYTIWYRNNAGTLQLLYNRGRANISDDFIAYNTTLTTGTWYYVTLTYDGTLRAYLNGSAVGTPITPSGNGAGTDASMSGFGRLYNDTLFLSGLVDEGAFWSKALSTTEITDLYNSGNGQTMILFTPTTCRIRQIGLCH